MKEITIDGNVYVLKEDVKDLDNCDYSEIIYKGNNIYKMLPRVLIRSYASGVHFGYLAEEKDLLSGKQVKLLNSRRIHYWVENASLSQIVQRGITDNEENRISVSIPEITITQVVEIMPLSLDVFTKMMNYREWKAD